MAPTPENIAGYTAQFGFRGDEARSVPFTRNEVRRSQVPAQIKAAKTV